MDWTAIVHIAGEGKEALYNLYIDAKRVGEALTMEELKNFLAELPEEEKKDDLCAVVPDSDLHRAGAAGLPAESGTGRFERQVPGRGGESGGGGKELLRGAEGAGQIPADV